MLENGSVDMCTLLQYVKAYSDYSYHKETTSLRMCYFTNLFLFPTQARLYAEHSPPTYVLNYNAFSILNIVTLMVFYVIPPFTHEFV